MSMGDAFAKAIPSAEGVWSVLFLILLTIAGAVGTTYFLARMPEAEVETLEHKRDQLKQEVQTLEEQKLSTQAQVQANEANNHNAVFIQKSLFSSIAKLKEDETVLKALQAGGTIRYILRVELKRVSHSFDLEKQLKASMSTEEFDIVTDKIGYDTANVGDDLFNSFKVGNLVWSSKSTSWRIRIISKRTQILQLER